MYIKYIPIHADARGQYMQNSGHKTIHVVKVLNVFYLKDHIVNKELTINMYFEFDLKLRNYTKCQITQTVKHQNRKNSINTKISYNTYLHKP